MPSGLLVHDCVLAGSAVFAVTNLLVRPTDNHCLVLHPSGILVVIEERSVWKSREGFMTYRRLPKSETRRGFSLT
jgi:hypothetical protein